MGELCRRCGASVEKEDKFCTVCGADLEKTRIDETLYKTQETKQTQQIQQTGGTWRKQEAQKTEDFLQKPLSFGEYLLLFLILAIPILNIVMLLIWSFSKEENVNRQYFSRAALIYVVAASIVYGIVFFWTLLFVVGVTVDMQNQNEPPKEGTPHNKIEEFLPDAQNDFVIAFTSVEPKKSNVEIGIDGITIL